MSAYDEQVSVALPGDKATHRVLEYTEERTGRTKRFRADTIWARPAYDWERSATSTGTGFQVFFAGPVITAVGVEHAGGHLDSLPATQVSADLYAEHYDLIWAAIVSQYSRIAARWQALAESAARQRAQQWAND